MLRLSLRLALLTAALLTAGLAQAQCRPSPSATELTIQGFATAYFQQFRTDTAGGAVELYGGVCLIGQKPAWTLAAQRVRVTGLKGVLQVSADDPTLTIAGWSATAASLDATRASLGLTQVRLTGHAVAGTAAEAHLDLATGDMRLSRIVMSGATFHLRGERATLSGDQLSVSDPSITTCQCVGSPLYDVKGASAKVQVQKQRIELSGGRLNLAGIVIPLANTVTLAAETLKKLNVPLTVEYIPSDASTGTTGTGLGVMLKDLGLAPGVATTVGATGLDPTYPLASVALLHGHAGGASFTFGKAPDGVRFEEQSDRPVTPWFDAGFDTRVLEPGNRDTLREGELHGRFHASVPSLGGAAALRLFAAASSQQPAGGTTVAGARLGAEASLAAASAKGAPWGRASMRVAVQGTAYPDYGTAQWGVDLQPAYAFSAGPLALRASYLARLTNGASPFTTTLDRLEPVERPSGSVRLSGALGSGWRASAGLAVTYDLVGNSSVDAGPNRFDADASISGPVGGWALSVSGKAALAGILAPNGVRDGYLQAAVGADRGALELGARARYRYAPTPAGLDVLELSAAVPLALPGFTLRPYLALDFAPTLRSGALPAISGHGLDLTVPTCCGTLRLGYRDDEGDWSVSFAIDLPTSSGHATACPQQAQGAPVIAERQPPAGVCPAPSGSTGIMTGAAAGPPS